MLADENLGCDTTCHHVFRPKKLGKRRVSIIQGNRHERPMQVVEAVFRSLHGSAIVDVTRHRRDVLVQTLILTKSRLNSRTNALVDVGIVVLDNLMLDRVYLDTLEVSTSMRMLLRELAVLILRRRATGPDAGSNGDIAKLNLALQLIEQNLLLGSDRLLLNAKRQNCRGVTLANCVGRVKRRGVIRHAIERWLRCIAHLGRATLVLVGAFRRIVDDSDRLLTRILELPSLGKPCVDRGRNVTCLLAFGVGNWVSLSEAGFLLMLDRG